MKVIIAYILTGKKKKKQAIYNYSARKINRASEAESHRVVLVFNRVTREGLIR